MKGILESAFVPCEMSFVGDKAVYDLTVEEVNHYISYDTGLVNKNSYSWLAIDEMGNYSDPTVFQMMLATVRSGYANINTRVRCTANPGGQGHHWLKTRYIDPFPLGYTPFKDSPSSTRERMYIPSRITDNKILLQNDKYYIENLRSQASPELVRAWLEGDWDVQLSSFFPDFDKAKHVVRPFNIPNHWPRFRSFDWGHADPFACLWIAVADGSAVMCDDGKQLVPPKGSLIVYRELYGMELNRPNVGVRWSNERIAAAIVKATGDDQIYDTVTDSLPFQNRGGPTIAEIMFRNGVKMRFGNTDRITGWAQIHSRLAGNERGPLLYIFDTCVHLIRTLPQLQHDKHKMEDVDDGYEDHACLSGDTRVMTDIGLIKIKEIKEACVVKDWMNRRRAATAAVLTRKQAQVVRLTMSNHQTVVCTPDHRFMLQDGTMERADRLLGKTLYVSPKSSPTQNRVLGAESSINTKVNGISARDDLDCIERFGRLSMERFLKAIMFTIRTVIQLIIGWRIWSCCQPKSIISYIVKPHHNFLIPRFGRLHLAGQQNGTSQTKVERVPWQIMKSSKIGFTEKSQNSVRNVTNPLQQFQTANFVVHDASKGMQPNQGLRQDSALSVARRLRRISTAEPNLAEPYVTELVSGCESVRCVRIEKLGLEDVYCLRVPNVGHFQIEGGLVSKNCDALRLACMERPIVRTPVEEKPFHGRLTFNELIKLDELNSEDD
ncbi:hypothetical protein E6Q11_06430 [Candidatus Dojkabacteria bacterium]|uniref:Hint domain-containing protein n=1 Tax=Candidatus Dojkabacteria bacterium TaxID=2099670 RepID=A0A5C7J2T3_9BACT|nr:MAG: hypothetical protein E6Q11_06430 [Candidatus Dojkabacteria bacterium]